MDKHLIPVIAIAGGTIMTTTFLYFCWQLANRWLDGRSGGARGALPAPDVVARLERIEHAVESIALEVERVSEGQRFLTKLHAEQRAIPASGARVDEPVR